MPGPSLENLFAEYVDPIPILPATVTSGNSAFHHYLSRHRFTDISLFNNERFAKKFSKLGVTPSQEQTLWSIANRVNLRAQAAFDKEHPL
jgi:hypothetical protein